MSLRARRAAAVGLALAAAAAGPAAAHVVYERTSLREWVTRSELVVVAAFESDALVWDAPDGSDRQEHFRVRAVETLHGAAPPEAFDFFPHAEGFPRFRAGDRALLFLERTGTRPEFAALAPRFAWFSVQGAGHEWTVAGAEGERILAVARRWLALRDDGPEDPTPAARAIVVEQLASTVARLRADGVAELMRMHALPGFLDAAGVAAFAPFASAPALSLAQRLAVVRTLDGAPGFAAPPHLRALAREAQAGSHAELAQMIRVAGDSDDPVLHAWLAGLAGDERPWVRRAVEQARATAAVRAAANADDAATPAAPR